MRTYHLVCCIRTEFELQVQRSSNQAEPSLENAMSTIGMEVVPVHPHHSISLKKKNKYCGWHDRLKLPTLFWLVRLSVCVRQLHFFLSRPTNLVSLDWTNRRKNGLTKTT